MQFSNIVGYQQIALPNGFSFFTSTFKNPTNNVAAIDLQDISSVQIDGSAWKTSGKSATKCAGDITIQKVDSEGNYLTAYSYFSTLTPQGWYDVTGSTYINKGTVSFANGEGFGANNSHTVGAKLLVSGEVTLTPSRILPNGFSFSGNFTPVSIDLQDISSVQIDGSAWKTSGKSATKCAGDITIQKVDSEGNYLTAYSYFSTLTPQGWYDVTGSTYISRGTVTFAAGEGFVVNNSHTVGAQIVLPAPVSE